MPSLSLIHLKRSRDAQSRRIDKIVRQPDSENEVMLRKKRDRLLTALIEWLSVSHEIKEREAPYQEPATPEVQEAP